MSSKQLLVSILSLFTLFSCNPGKGGDEKEKEKTGILTYEETISYVEKHSMTTPSKPISGHIEYTHNNHIVATNKLSKLGAIITKGVTEGNNDINQSLIDTFYNNIETGTLEDRGTVILALTKTNFSKLFNEYKDEYVYKVENNNLYITYDKTNDSSVYKYVRTYNSNLCLTKFEIDVNADEEIKYTATQTFNY